MASLKVNLAVSHLESIARHLGSQGVDACPPSVECWRFRKGEHTARFTPDTADNECANCHMHWIQRG